MDRIKRPKSLTELATNMLRSEIVEGILKMGATLSEVGTARRLGVSRTPVREAFARLDLEGLVRTEPQRGTFVFTLTGKELEDICDVRVCLETAALRASMLHDATALSIALEKTVVEMTKAHDAGDDRTYLACDTQFHQRLLDHADNCFLDDAYQTIAHKMAALRNRLCMHPDHMAKSFDEHRRIATAVARGDVEEAEAILIAHIGRKEGSYWSLATHAGPDDDLDPGDRARGLSYSPFVGQV